jgi:hypothetical protein
MQVKQSRPDSRQISLASPQRDHPDRAQIPAQKSAKQRVACHEMQRPGAGGAKKRRVQEAQVI